MKHGIITNSKTDFMMFTESLRETIIILKGLKSKGITYSVLHVNPRIKINPDNIAYVAPLA